MMPRGKVSLWVSVLTFWFLKFSPLTSEAAYQVKSNGFLVSFNRNEPLLLFRTTIGIQVLMGNQYVQVPFVQHH